MILLPSLESCQAVADSAPCLALEFVSFSARKPVAVFENLPPSVFPLVVRCLAEARERPHREKGAMVRAKMHGAASEPLYTFSRKAGGLIAPLSAA